VIASRSVGLTTTTHREAITTALEPWSIHVVEITAPALPGQMPDAARDARAIATERGVDAIAWVSESPSGRSLWLYDLRNDQLVLRQIGGDPEEESSAAAVALTLKTLLRASTIAPPQERLGGEVSPGSPRPRRLRIEVAGGARLFATNTSAVSPRLGVAVAWWPQLFAQRISLGLRLEEGLGTSIHTEEFRGRLGDHAAGLFARGSFPIGGRFFFEPGIGATAHLMTLDGAPIDSQPSDVTRLNPSVDGSLGFFAAFGQRVDVGARLSGSVWTRWQSYQLDRGRAFEVSPVQMQAEIFVGAVLD
jgi:hypothetical protein